MFKWFESGSNHPFANVKKAREKLSGLPKDNPLKTLEELSDWVESLSGMRLTARTDICRLFDEYSQPYRRKLGKDYFSCDSVQQRRIGFAFHRFATLLGKTYVSCIESYRAGEKGADDIRDELPLIFCRALNALKSQYKWAHLHLGLIDESIWKRLFRLFAFAEKIGITRVETALYSAHEHKTSVDQEFLKILMLSSSSPDALKPLEFEIANHVVSLLSPYFILAPNETGLTHFVDLSSGKPPARVKPPLQGIASLRFFGAGNAHAVVRKLLDETGELPREITLGGTYSADETRSVLNHLFLQWSAQPLLRKSERHRAAVSITATSRLDFSETEAWTSENISEGGYDAVIPGEFLEWEKIGLLFFSKHAESWNLCIIRRINRDDQKRWHAGVEILAKNILPLELKTEKSTLLAALVRLEEDRLEAEVLAEDRGFSPSSRYETGFGGKKHILVPLEILEKGFGFRLWRFRLANP